MADPVAIQSNHLDQGDHDPRLIEVLLRPGSHLHPSWLDHLDHKEVILKLIGVESASQALSTYLLDQIAGGEASHEIDLASLDLSYKEALFLRADHLDYVALSLALALSHRYIRGVVHTHLRRKLMNEIGNDNYVFAMKTAPFLLREWPECRGDLAELWLLRLKHQDFSNMLGELSKVGRWPVRARLALILEYPFGRQLLTDDMERAHQSWQQGADQSAFESLRDGELSHSLADPALMKLLTKILRRIG